ncbi:MAG: oligosaccharide flippase family protein [Eggerthellaceae bacterium]|nr:oligosaccharide flippase family protein [Eggerthellaceae bacterium]
MAVKEKKLLANTGWLLVLQAVNILLPFVTVPYVTRVFGADLYGVFSIALNWIMYFQLVVEYGFNLSATKKVVEAESRTEYDLLVAAVVAARLSLVVICFVVALVMAYVSAVSGGQLCCMLVLFSMLIGIALQLNWLFQGLQDMKMITVATASARFLSVVLIFLLINNQDQLVLYAFLYSITYLASGVLTHILAWKRHQIRVRMPSLRMVLREMRDGTPIFLSSAAGKIIGNVGVTVLGASQPAAAVGAYAAVLKIPQMVSLMFSPISQALYPRVNEERLKSERLAIGLVAKFGIPVITLFAFILVAIVALRDPLVCFLFGSDYLSATDALIPLSIWVLLGIANNLLGVQLLIPFGYQKLYSRLMIIDALVALALNLFLGPTFGVMGVASAIAISEAVLAASLLVSLVFIVRKNKRLNKRD